MCRVCPGDFRSSSKSKVNSVPKVVDELSCLGGLKVSTV